MGEWEYTTRLLEQPSSYTLKDLEPNIRSMLSELGSNGWELVGIQEGSGSYDSYYVYVFKRPKQ